MNESENNFFSEVDEKKNSLKFPWTILVVVFLIIIGLGTYGLLKIRNVFSNTDFNNWNISQGNNINLSQKILDLSNQDSSEVTLEISSIELSAYLNLEDENFPLKNTYAKIKPNEIKIYGRLKSSRFGLPASATFTPNVKDGNVNFENKPTDMEKIYMPGESRNNIAKKINERFTFDFSLRQHLIVTSILAEEDKLVLHLSKNP